MKMSEPMMKRAHLAALFTNLFFLTADMLETIGMEFEELNAEVGCRLPKREQNHFDLALKHIKALRGMTKKLDGDTQEQFGNDAELLADVMYAAVSRTGTDDSIMYEILEYIMQRPDRVGLDGVRKGGEAFERIKKEMAQKRIEEFMNRDAKVGRVKAVKGKGKKTNFGC